MPDTKTLTPREFDAELARRLFGWNWVIRTKPRKGTGRFIYPNEHGIFRWATPAESVTILAPDWDFKLPFYSTDWSAAGLVVEAILKRPCRDGDSFVFSVFSMTEEQCDVAFHHHLADPLTKPEDWNHGFEWFSGRGKTFPEAITLAALAALGAAEKEGEADG